MLGVGWLGSPRSLMRSPGSFVFDVADRQPEQLDGGQVVGEVAAVLGDFAELVVQRLDRVRRVDHPPQRRRERQERDEPFPRVTERFDRRRVLLAERSRCERLELDQGSVVVGGRDRSASTQQPTALRSL